MRKAGIVSKCGVLAPLLVVLLLGGTRLQASIVVEGFLSTPVENGIISGGGSWLSSGGGFRLTWTVFQNVDYTWHYKYEFSKENGDPLVKLLSHIIISLSDDIQENELYNLGVDVGELEFGEFGPSSPGNPGFPAGETISGVKIGLTNAQAVVEFDATREPMWGDFYAKDGVNGDALNYAYNTDLGVLVDNQHAYMETPVDASQNALHKILVPDTYIPEPATICLLGFGALSLLRKRRA